MNIKKKPKKIDQINPKFHLAVFEANIPLIDKLLSKIDSTTINSPISLPPNHHLSDSQVVGNCPIHLAILSGNLHVLERILQHKSINVNMYNSHGQAPLHMTCSFCPKEQTSKMDKMVSLLVLSGANTNLEEKTFTYLPLHLASNWNRPWALKVLLDTPGTIVNARHHQKTALHLAVESSSVQCVYLLLTHQDTFVHSRDEKENTPLNIAENLLKTSRLKVVLAAQEQIVQMLKHHKVRKKSNTIYKSVSSLFPDQTRSSTAPTRGHSFIPFIEDNLSSLDEEEEHFDFSLDDEESTVYSNLLTNPSSGTQTPIDDSDLSTLDESRIDFHDLPPPSSYSPETPVRRLSSSSSTPPSFRKLLGKRFSFSSTNLPTLDKNLSDSTSFSKTRTNSDVAKFEPSPSPKGFKRRFSLKGRFTSSVDDSVISNRQLSRSPDTFSTHPPNKTLEASTQPSEISTLDDDEENFSDLEC